MRVYRPVESVQAAKEPVDYVEITDPITLEFSVSRGVNAGYFATLNAKLYNLNSDTRRFMFFDVYDLSRYMRIQLEVGYGNTLSLIFDGRAQFVHSQRSGTEVTTTILAMERDFLNPTVSRTFAAGCTTNEIITTIIDEYLELSQAGVIDIDNQKHSRAYSATGGAYYILNKISGGKINQVGRVINAIRDNQAFKGSVPVINASTGLLGTPERAEAFLVCRTLMEPQLILGQLIRLESEFAPQWNGQFKISRIAHSGLISGAVCGQAVTELQMFNLNGDNFEIVG